MADVLPAINELSAQSPVQEAAAKNPANPEAPMKRDIVIGTFNDVLSQMQNTFNNKLDAHSDGQRKLTKDDSAENNYLTVVKWELSNINGPDGNTSLKQTSEVDPSHPGKELRVEGMLGYLDKKIAVSKEHALHQPYQGQEQKKIQADIQRWEGQKQVLLENSRQVPFDEMADGPHLNRLTELVDHEVSEIVGAGEGSTNPDPKKRNTENIIKGVRNLRSRRFLVLPSQNTPGRTEPTTQTLQQVADQIQPTKPTETKSASAARQLILPVALAALLAAQGTRGTGRPDVNPNMPNPNPVPTEMKPNPTPPPELTTPQTPETKPLIKLIQHAPVRVGSDYEGWLQHEIAKVQDPTLVQREQAQGKPVEDDDPQLLTAFNKFKSEYPDLYGPMLDLMYQGVYLNNEAGTLLVTQRGENYDPTKQYPKAESSMYNGNYSFKFGNGEVNYLDPTDVLTQLKANRPQQNTVPLQPNL